MKVFVNCKRFMKKNALKKIVGFKSDEMDILGCKSSMNANGRIFNLNDVVSVAEKKFKIIGFASYDDSYIGAIVVGKNKDIAKYIDLGDKVKNLSEAKRNKGTVKSHLIESGFRELNDESFSLLKLTIELQSDKTFDAYLDSNDLENMIPIISEVPVCRICDFLSKVDKCGLPNMFFECVPTQYLVYIRSCAS